MEDLVWKKKSAEVSRFVMLFFIRLSEVLTASIIPSIIGVVLVYINPQPIALKAAAVLSSMAFTAVSCVFWVRYVKHRRDAKEFYLLNGIVYTLYILISVLLFIVSDAYMYTIIFSNLRGLELFGAKTLTSLVVTHSGNFVAMILSERLARVYYTKVDAYLATLQAEKAEMEFESDAPSQADEEVTFLTVDEVNLELEREIAEAASVMNEAAENGASGFDDITRGDGAEVESAEPFDPEFDIDDDDYFSEAYARKEMQDNENYDSDSLWNTEIYQGNEPMYDYPDDDDDDDEIEFYRVENEDFWGEGDGTFDVPETAEFAENYDDESDDDEFGGNGFLDYDTDSLWGDIKQGK